MTGTACDIVEHNQNETSCLNNFDLFSMWLFEKIKHEQLPAKAPVELELAEMGDDFAGELQ